MYRSAGTRLASINFVCRRFDTLQQHPARELDKWTRRGSHGHWCREHLCVTWLTISANTTRISSGGTTATTRNGPFQTRTAPQTNSRSLYSDEDRAYICMKDHGAVLPGGRSCRMITEMFEKKKKKKRGVFDFIEEERERSSQMRRWILQRKKKKQNKKGWSCNR